MKKSAAGFAKKGINFIFNMDKFIFNPNAKVFDLRNALLLGEASALAYKPEQNIEEQIINEWGFESFKYFNKRDTQAFIAVNNEIMILIFRGTQSIQDWLTDFKVKFVKGPFGMVHRGFSQGLNYILPDIKKAIAKYHNQKQSLWVAGHSLGGALAVLTAAYFVERRFKIDGLYTFGQPRVGNYEFVNSFGTKFNKRHFRIVNNEDIVTRVPPRALGYFDSGNVLYLDSFGVLRNDPKWWQEFLDISYSFIMRASDRFKVLRKQFPNSLEDHDMDRYIERIKSNIPRNA